MEALAVIGPMVMEAAPYIGMAAEAGGTIYSGAQERGNADFEAKQLKLKGEEELAIAQREASKSRKEGDLAISRARAVAASSGGGTDNATVAEVLGDLETKKQANVLTDMYRGFQSRADLYTQAGIRKKEGRDAQTGSYLDAASGLATSIYGVARDKRRAAAME